MQSPSLLISNVDTWLDGVLMDLLSLDSPPLMITLLPEKENSLHNMKEHTGLEVMKTTLIGLELQEL